MGDVPLDNPAPIIHARSPRLEPSIGQIHNSLSPPPHNWIGRKPLHKMTKIVAKMNKDLDLRVYHDGYKERNGPDLIQDEEVCAGGEERGQRCQ
jgi:energy-converting hydrogenase Eha subunit F